jgi:hypothetical protein
VAERHGEHEAAEGLHPCTQSWCFWPAVLAAVRASAHSRDHGRTSVVRLRRRSTNAARTREVGGHAPPPSKVVNGSQTSPVLEVIRAMMHVRSMIYKATYVPTSNEIYRPKRARVAWMLVGGRFDAPWCFGEDRQST